jgi:DNA-binding CsgD family transcriptional regulator
MASKGPIATREPIGRDGPSAERSDPVSRTVALVDLRPVIGAHNDGGHDARTAYELALRRIEQVVRADDRVCPFGVSRVAIAFGPDAESVTPKMLGERLARAVRQRPLADSRAVSTVGPKVQPAGRRPPMSGEDATMLRTVPTPPWSTTVTVDRLPGELASQLWHRTVVRYSTGGFARYGTRHDDPSVPSNRGTILVISPCRASGGAPGLPAVAASAVAERLGFEVSAVALTGDDELVLDIQGAPLDLVVLVVEGERDPTSDLVTWASSTWHVPAQLAARYFSKGIGVLAVGAGAGPGALAGCQAQGASVLLDLDELQAELSHLGVVLRPDDSWSVQGAGGRVPPPMEALLLLTASERRVLFYLTTGRSAQDIADDLVVSVTTVRSHIRSILRKLGVRSQLAAVAIANGQDCGRIHPGGGAPDLQRELEAPGVG